MDAFFVSVELLQRPELRGSPVIVGGTGRRGVVAAASYEARSYGIHSAMPSATAHRLCPHAIFLNGDHSKYAAVSERIMATFRRVTPEVEPLSLDEAFLDVSGARRLHGSPQQIARRLRATILKQESLTCSVGIAPNKFLAKLGSENAKPKASRQGPVFGDGVFEVEPGQELEFLWPLEIRSIWGVGAKTAERLHGIGIETVGDLAKMPVSVLEGTLGSGTANHLHRLAHGLDERDVETGRAAKSIGHEQTFPHDLLDPASIDRALVRLSDATVHRLRGSELVARTVTIKVRFGDFRTITRRSTSKTEIRDHKEVLAIARSLISTIDTSPGLRLLGVSVAQLHRDAGQQLDLFVDAGADDVPDQSTLVDEVREKFGVDAIGWGSAMTDGHVKAKRRGDQQWGPDATPA